jgi:hypothetical protein
MTAVRLITSFDRSAQRRRDADPGSLEFNQAVWASTALIAA